jgi:hypothetical protein
MQSVFLAWYKHRIPDGDMQPPSRCQYVWPHTSQNNFVQRRLPVAMVDMVVYPVNTDW